MSLSLNVVALPLNNAMAAVVSKVQKQVLESQANLEVGLPAVTNLMALTGSSIIETNSTVFHSTLATRDGASGASTSVIEGVKPGVYPNSDGCEESEIGGY